MLGAGIKTTADIEINLHLNKTAAWNQMKASVKELKTSLNDLAKTVGIEKGVKNYAALERELKKVQTELKKTQSALKDQDEAQKELVGETERMITASKGVTYQFSAEGKMIGALAREIDEADHELRGLSQAMDMVGKETKEDIALEKQFAAAVDKAQKEASALAKTEKELAQERLAGGRAIQLGKAQEQHLVDFRKQQAKIAKDLERVETRRNKALKDSEAAIRRKAAAEKAANAEGLRAAAIAKRLADEEMKRERSMSTLIGRINKYETAMDAVFRASFRLKMAGNDLMDMSRRVLTSFGNMMNEFGEFEFMLNRAAGALAVTDDLMDELLNSVLDLSVAMRLFPAKDVAQALYFWGSTTGQVVQTEQDLLDTMQALNPIMKAAAMTNTGYEATIKGVYSILAQYYNGSISMAASVTEDLFYITQKTAAEFPDLINAFKMVGPIAKANSVSFRDMVNLFGQLADLGVRGTMAGRAFRQMFIQMVRPSGPALKAINRLFEAARENVKEFNGKSYYELMFPKGEFVGTQGYINNLALAVRSLSEAERNSFLAKIATANELPVLTALVNEQIRALDGLTKEQDKNVVSSKESAKYFEDNWRRLQNSWKGIVGSLKSTFEALKMSVADVMAEALSPFMEDITKVVEKIREWAKAPENRELIAFLGKLVIVGSALTGAIGAVLTLTGALIGLGAASVIAIRAFSRFVPLIGGIITGVAAFADAFIRNFDEIKSAVDYAAQTITKSFNDVGVNIGSLTDVINSVTEPIRGFMDIIVKGGVTAIRVIADVIAKLNELGWLLPALKGIAGVMAAMFAARAVTAMLGMAKAVGALSLGFVGLGKASKNINATTGAIGRLKSVVGMGGLATLILGAGFIAYEANIGGFGDGIDSITDSFRDLKKEIQEISAEFGAAQFEVQAFSQTMASSMTDFGLATPKRTGVGLAVPSGDDKSDWPSAFKGILDRRAEELSQFSFESMQTFDSIEAIMAERQRRMDKLSIDIMTTLTAKTFELNTMVAEATQNGPVYTDEDMGKMVSSLFPLFKDDLPGSTNALFDTARDVLLQQAKGEGVEQMRAIYNELAAQYAQIARITFDEFLGKVGSENKTASSLRAEQVVAARAALYQPVIDTLDSIIGSGASGAEIEKFLVQPIMHNMNGEMIPGQSLAAISGLLNDQQREIWAAALEIIGKPASDLDGMETEFANIIEERWKPVANMINNSLVAETEAQMFDTMQIIGDNLQEVSRQLPNIGMDKGVAAGEALKDMVAEIVEYNLSPESIPDYVKEAVNMSADLILKNGGLTITDVNAIEKAMGIVGEEVAEDVSATFQEMTSAFTAGVDLKPKEFHKAVRDALKRGTDLKQVGNILKDFMSKDLRRALRGNLQSRALADEFMQTSADGLIGALQATDGKKQRGLAIRIGRFINRQWENMPKAAQVKWEPVIQELLSGKVTLPEGIVTSLAGKIGAEVDTVIAEVTGSVAKMGGNTPDAEKNFGHNEYDKEIHGYAEEAAKKATSGNKIQIEFTPEVKVNTVPQAEMNTAMETAVTTPAKAAVATVTPAVSAAINQNITGVANTAIETIKSLPWGSTGIAAGTALSNGIIIGYETNNISGRVSQTLGFIDQLHWGPIGAANGNALSGGIIAGYAQNDISGRVSQTLGFINGLPWDATGNAAGQRLSSNIISGYGKNNITARVNQTLTSINGLGWASVGSGVGSTFSAMWIAGYGRHSISTRVQQTLSWINGLNWSSGGANSGAAWGKAFAEKVASYARSAAAAAEAVTAGNSPPKKGPLRHIDKGGANVGKAWGKGLVSAAERETFIGMKKVKSNMQAKGIGGSFGVDATYENKRSIDINIKIDGGSDANRETASQLRRSVYDALMDNDILSHMVVIS
jgi:TP901 family phage tail tape measure protein